MSITHTNTHSVKSDATSSPLQSSAVEVGASEISIDQSFPASTADSAVAVAFTVAGVQSIFILATADTTIETNSGTSPGDTISLKAGRMFVWERSPGYFANPFSADVTAFYVTCSAASRLRARILAS